MKQMGVILIAFGIAFMTSALVNGANHTGGLEEVLSFIGGSIAILIGSYLLSKPLPDPPEGVEK